MRKNKRGPKCAKIREIQNAQKQERSKMRNNKRGPQCAKIERSRMRSNRDKLREHRKIQDAQLIEGSKGAKEIGISAHK